MLHLERPHESFITKPPPPSNGPAISAPARKTLLVLGLAQPKPEVKSSSDKRIQKLREMGYSVRDERLR